VRKAKLKNAGGPDRVSRELLYMVRCVVADLETMKGAIVYLGKPITHEDVLYWRDHGDWPEWLKEAAKKQAANGTPPADEATDA